MLPVAYMQMVPDLSRFFFFFVLLTLNLSALHDLLLSGALLKSQKKKKKRMKDTWGKRRDLDEHTQGCLLNYVYCTVLFGF